VAAKKPGTRKSNPLSKYASYTYQITLYMITPDAFNAFVASGRTDVNIFKNWQNSGSFIIAQSGGVNLTMNDRLPGINYDYYIDDLRIKTATNAKDTGGGSNVTEMRFSIYEPYGFSFLNELQRGFITLRKNNSSIKEFQSSLKASRQFFVLGIRFYGYDISGNIISKEGDFEKFYDIVIDDIKFRIDGSSTRYEISAKSAAPSTAFGSKFGMLDNTITIIANTVEDALIGDDKQGISGLMERLNGIQEELYNTGSIEIPSKYNLIFRGDGAQRIKNAQIFTKDDMRDKRRWPTTVINKISDVNPGTEIRATNDPNKRIMSLSPGMPIQQAIESVIKQSTYLADALKVVYDSTENPESDVQTESEVHQRTPILSWYYLSVQIKVLGWDKKTRNWAYEFTYIIEPYQTPVVTSAYAGRTNKYYGPHKVYEYWFTGQNTEVLRFEQSLNNLWHNLYAALPNDVNAPNVSGDVTYAPNKVQNGDRSGKLMYGMEAQNSYLTDLKDPGSFADARLEIMGDPDFLMGDSSASVNQVYNQFYAPDNFTINANGGQVFIEIVFNEAKDYNDSTGLMTVNNAIRFVEYPKSLDIKGVSYLVVNVESTFAGGTFKQRLHCKLNTFPDYEIAERQREREANENDSENRRLLNRAAASRETVPQSQPPPTGLRQDAPTYDPEAWTGGYPSPPDSVSDAPVNSTPDIPTPLGEGREEGGLPAVLNRQRPRDLGPPPNLSDIVAP